MDDAGALGRLLAPLGEERRLPAGCRLWSEGDPGDSVAFLIEGRLEVVHEDPDGESVVLRTLEPGAVAGEIAALDGRTRSAAVRAAADCRLLRIDATAFRGLLRERPDVLEALYWLQVDRVRSLTSLVGRSHKRAITDQLTGLYNFGFFRERLAIELERARATRDTVSLAMFDVDHFKLYNDHSGHQAGNDALVAIAAILEEHARRGDVIARYGGEEFVALLYGAGGEELAAYAERARAAVERSDFPGGARQPGGRVTVSAGTALFPADAADEAGLVAAADRRLYEAKSAGRNRVAAGPASERRGEAR